MQVQLDAQCRPLNRLAHLLEDRFDHELGFDPLPSPVLISDLGMHFIYLEGGSGAKTPVPPEMIRTVKHVIDVPLIVGGGIRTKGQALNAASAGADIIVTGNIIESTDAKQKVSEIIDGVKRNRA